MVSDNFNVKKYSLTPAIGQAILNFNNRLSANELYMQVYDSQKEELYNPDNKEELDGYVFDGDCLSVCAKLRDDGKLVDLVYIDPPFASNADYVKKIYLRNQKEKENIIADNSIGEEIMYNDIWSKEDYLNWLYVRLLAIKEVMSENASIFVHLDWHIAQYVKVLLDEVFGEANFVNEIIWSYRSGGASKEGSLPKKHDNIFLYRKGEKNIINNKIERQYLERPFMDSKIDDEGRYYVDTILRDVLEGAPTIVHDDGSLEEYNMRPVLNLSKERVDYSTQKPEGLLKMLIEIASNEGQVVADFFGGSGVTANVAYKTNRKFITCDIGKNSIQTIRDRLINSNAAFEIIDIKDGIDLDRNPVETVNKLFYLFEGAKRNLESDYSDLWDGEIPYRNEMTLTKIIDNKRMLDEEYLDYLITNINIEHSNDNRNKYLITYIYKGANIDQKMVNKKLLDEGVDYKVYIEPIENLLKMKKNKIIQKNSAVVSINRVGTKYRVKIEKFFSPYLKNKVDEFNNKIKDKSKKISYDENGYQLIESIQFDTTMEEEWRSRKDLEVKIGKKDPATNGEFILDTDTFYMKIRDIVGEEIIINSKEMQFNG